MVLRQLEYQQVEVWLKLALGAILRLIQVLEPSNPVVALLNLAAVLPAVAVLKYSLMEDFG